MRYLSLLLLCTTLSFISVAQRSQKNKNLRAYLDNKQFYAPGVGNYVEFHLQFDGPSLTYKGSEGGLIGEVAVQMSIQGEDGFVSNDAYRLSSPLMIDSIVEDFYDVRRFQLDPGGYNFKLQLEDMNSEANPLSVSFDFFVEDLSDAISLSDIEVAEIAYIGDENSNFYKSGYEIIPRLSTYYPEQLNTIPVYFEVYNSEELEDSVFALKQEVINSETGKAIDDLTEFTRYKSAPVVPVLKSVKIDEVFTGKYILKYTLINRNMTELSVQTYEFERTNDQKIDYFSDEIILDPNFQTSISDDSVAYYLESLIPISRPAEVRNIIYVMKLKDVDKARKHLQLFWTKTSPINPYEGWIKYKQQVQLVEKLYANNFQEGFETDRGRVYLQYGAPTEIITRENSPTEYPYEIWQYNKIGRFSNKRFVFYNPNLVNKAYRLLHSDMIGELKNPAWPRELAKRNSTNGNVDNPNQNTIDHWGGNSDDFMRQY